ncbi:hypothetical protein JDV02_001509 [Purpureocillium takamizusanense]|uniref:SCP domain-containing protein n=1 Tax=Purpureocillium takamizusanense TaxID=2060973 RepID=A0A9Q8V7W7_9HYPO|nr:uncharacterized protein JDV02_001509 [Purpureocillium takamizusanense]UNI14931.1 hypothetical protein JDV02_001509 [Purpureocillium takamizusanense]
MYRLACFVSLVLFVGLSVAATPNEDLNNALATVNQARQAKGVRPLQWDPDLAGYAQTWANFMASDSVAFSHAPSQYRQNQGENIYDRESGQGDFEYDNPVLTAMRSWLSQAPLYDDKPVTGHEKWLHWSQCMWSNTTHIGCARAYSISTAYKVYDVCRFYPQGNIVGEKPFERKQTLHRNGTGH